ncbi:MAG: helix-turn-helix transcriptional regulator [Legionellaceae bacterium]|nr:helix-turn-helix transcriptional regulator [Legionellaceae bacterium]
MKGLRHREGLSQIAFAKALNITQTNLSAMENGRRSIGKALAKRIANQFNIDYRLFL